jgi:ectoine hydroxylase-related dioxygenase (phytanoyl-CoA dioxygenase family)
MVTEWRSALARDGFVVLRGVVATSVLDELGEILRSLERRGQPRSRQVLYTHAPAPAERPPLDVLMDQWLSPHRLAPPNTLGPARVIRTLAADLLDTEPVLFQDLLLRKRPGQRPFAWHQDYPFWPVDAPEGVVVWVPLAAADERRGGLAFARGSHRLGPRPVVDLHDGTPQDPGAELGFDLGQFEIVAPRYERGDAVAFLPTTFHGSPAMRAAGTRTAWSSVWLRPGLRWSHANAPRHPLCKQVRDGAPIEELGHAD